jgi:hypothetical protein
VGVVKARDMVIVVLQGRADAGGEAFLSNKRSKMTEELAIVERQPSLKTMAAKRNPLFYLHSTLQFAKPSSIYYLS